MSRTGLVAKRDTSRLREALLGNRQSPLGLCLANTLASELEPAAHESTQISTRRFNHVYLEAMVWANSIADEMGMD